MDQDDVNNIVVKWKINFEYKEIEIIGEPIPKDHSTFEEF